MRGLFHVCIVVLALFLPACAAPTPEPQTVTKPDTAPVDVTLVNTLTDSRAIGASLGESAGKILAGVQAMRELTRAGWTAAAGEALARALDGLVVEGARVQAQAEAVDPGVTRQLEAMRAQVRTLQTQYDDATAAQAAEVQRLKDDHAKKVGELEKRNKALEEERDRARNLSWWAPFFLFGIPIGAALIGLKWYPNPVLQRLVPGELGAGIIGGCLISLGYIHTQGRYPMETAIAFAVLAFLLLVPTIWRLNFQNAPVQSIQG